MLCEQCGMEHTVAGCSGIPHEAVELMAVGATSFSEAEAIEQAEDMWDEIAELVGSFNTLMGNIVMAPAEALPVADRPAKISALTDEFLTRLASLGSEQRKELTALKEESPVGLIGKLKRMVAGKPAPRQPVVGKAMQAAAAALAEIEDEKATSKTEDGTAFPRADYAVRGDVNNTATWKLRLTEAPGKPTVAQVARAITAMQPGGFRGNEVQLASGEKAEAIRNITAAINKLADGTEAAKITTLRNRLNAVKESSPVLTLTKDASGQLRWLFRASNRWRDRDYGKHEDGEIMSEEAHKEFVAWCDKTRSYPEAWLWHTPGTKWGTGDFAAYDSGFLLLSGTVDPGMEAVAQVAAKEENGASLGYAYRTKDRTPDGVYWRYRGFEVSALPRAYAANMVTGLDLHQMKEATNMIQPAEKRAFLVKALGADVVAGIESANATIAKELDAVVDWKSLTEVESKDATAIAEAPATEAPAATVAADVVAEAQAVAAAAEAAVPVAEAPVAPAPALPAELSSALSGIASSMQALNESIGGLNAKLEAQGAQLGAQAEEIKALKSASEVHAAERAAAPSMADVLGNRPTVIDDNVISAKTAEKAETNANVLDPFLRSIIGPEAKPTGAAAE